jgi:protein-disulfide isomerase
VPPEPTAPTSPEDEEPPRSRRLLFILIALGVVSAVIAGVVIFSSSGSTAPPEDPEAKLRTSGESLTVGSSDAPTKVVVHEDFGSRKSRDFETASRDFLRVEAAQGKVLVEYRPFSLADGYSRRALEAWAAVLEGGTPKQTLAFHDELFDRQPASGSAAAAASDLESWAVDAGVDKGLASDAVERSDPDFVKAARQAARAADVETAPTVLVDGKPFGSGSGVELADQLQRKILAD